MQDDSPAENLVDEYAQPWDRYEIIAVDQLRIFFPSGDARCHGARTLVEEDQDEIRVSLLVGRRSEATDPCTLIGRTASLVVTTSDPIGSRQVVPLDVSQ